MASSSSDPWEDEGFGGEDDWEGGESLEADVEDEVEEDAVDDDDDADDEA